MMNADNQSSSPWLPTATVALVIAAVGSAFYLRSPLESQRPSEAPTALQAPSHQEVVLARLWQDPLDAIHTHWNASQRGGTIYKPPTIETFADQLAARPPNTRELRLVAMAPGLPYSFDRETRRRQRHAVVTALTRNKYVPKDEDRIGYFIAPRFGEGRSVGTTQHPDVILIGYEWYEPGLEPFETRGSPTIWDEILVLWINGEDFDQYPIARLSSLLGTIDRKSDPAYSPTTVLLGPDASHRLSAMLNEPADEHNLDVIANGEQFFRRALHCKYKEADSSSLSCMKPARSEQDELESFASARKRARQTLHILSPRATIPLERLACKYTDEEECRQTYHIALDATNEKKKEVERAVRDQLEVHEFRTLIAGDNVVLQLILRELIDRGACDRMPAPESRGPSIAIVAEQDTLYGRALDDVAREVAAKMTECKFRVSEYGYVRGVDGEVPLPHTIGFAADRSIEAASVVRTDMGRRRNRELGIASLFRSGHEPSFGVAQLDYLRRLALRIERDVRTSAVAAIGVLGLDVYDKLLVLQALRDRLPSVTFFTVDLDARLLDPDVYQWTRNVIVGSAYGLHLPGAEAAEFRDSYQTAFFNAVLSALRMGGTGDEEARCLPRLFEIGRTRVVEVGKRPPSCNGDRLSSMVMTRDRGFAILGLVSPLIALAIFAFSGWRRRSRKTEAIRRRWNGLVAVGGIASTALVAVFTTWIMRYEPEPILEGVSSVPFVTLQATTILFAAGIIAFSHGRTTAAREYLAKSMAGRGDEGARKERNEKQGRSLEGRNVIVQCRMVWAALANQVSLLSTWRREIAGTQKGGERSAEEMWQDYRRYGDWRARLWRIGGQAVVVLCVSRWFLGGGSDAQPLVSRLHWISEGMQIPLGVALFLAIFYCSDTLGMWRVCIKALSHYRIVGWNGNGSREKSEKDVIIQVEQKMALLVRFTELVGPLIVLPLGLMVLMLVGRSTVFEGWNWPWEFVTFNFGFFVYILWSAVSFQVEASGAREALLEDLREARIEADEDGARRIGLAIEHISGRQKGAFVPWIQHPILQSVAVPVGGFVVITVLEVMLLP